MLHETCEEVKKLDFKTRYQDIELERQRVFITGIQQEQYNRDVEQETIIQNMVGRMNSMETKFDDFRKEVKSDVNSIKAEIPAMFTAAVNALLAKIAKWLLLCLGSLLLVTILIIGLAFLRPAITNGLQELTNKMQGLTEQSRTMEIPNVLTH